MRELRGEEDFVIGVNVHQPNQVGQRLLREGLGYFVPSFRLGGLELHLLKPVSFFHL